VEVEHIIQDGGTEENVDAWMRNFPHARFIQERDEGMYDAINRGLRRATGDVCAYLNCDEQYLPDSLSLVAEFFSAHPGIDVLFGDVILVDFNGRPLSYRRVVLPTLEHVQLVHLNTPTCATFFRRRLLDRGFYFDPNWKVVGDAVWLSRLLKDKVKMATVRRPLAVFTQTGTNLGATVRSEQELEKWQGPRDQKRFRRTLASLRHRMRKAGAGAYRRRRVEVKIFTPESPNQRQLLSGTVGFGWVS